MNGVNLRITEGLIKSKKKTYLLYANGSVVGEFYAVNDIKKIIKYIENNLTQPLTIYEKHDSKLDKHILYGK